MTKTPFLYISDFLKVALLLNVTNIKVRKIIPEKNDAHLHENSHKDPYVWLFNV